ncbi:reverse transcriptase domain-containing protein, partial [Tanacetum coccineum]
MRTRNSNFPNNSPVTIPRRRNRRRAPSVVEPELRTIVEVAPIAERTMEELLRAPTEGYGEAIVIPKINADHFEIKTNLLQLVQASPFHGFERENPHTHINNFKRITSTLKFRDVPNDVIKLMMFPYSLEGAARVWYDKEPPNSILTWEDLVTKFVNQFFPPSKTTHLKNEISRFTQKFEETFSEAWERFKEMLRACPHHGFTELTQIDTFYNGLNDNDQDSLNAAAGGNLLSKTTREALNIIENKSKVRYSRNKSNVSRMNTTSRESFSKTDERIDKLADQISTLVEIVSKKVVTPATVKAVEEPCVTCGGAHAYYNCPNTDSNQSSVCAATGTYNQVAPPNRVSNHMAPPGFAPVQNNGQNRFGGNDESKKMQKYILKQQFEGFSVSNSEGLHKGYDRFQSLLKYTSSTNDVVNRLWLFLTLLVNYSTIKLPILKKGEYDIWAMKMEHYLAHTDYPVWEVIQNGNGHVSISTDTQGQIKILPPKSAEEILAREKERKKRTTLLMALPEDHLARFHNISNAKEMWDAIKTRFGGNAKNTGYKGRDQRTGKQEQPKALLTIDAGVIDWSGQAEEEEEDHALMAFNSNSSSNKVQSCSDEYVASYNKLKQLYDEQRELLGDASIEIQAYTQALKKVKEQLVSHQQNQLWYEEKIRFIKIDLDDKTDVLTYHKKLLAEAEKEKEDLKAKVEKWHNSSKNLNILLNSQMSAKDKPRLGYGNQMNKSILSYKNEVFQSVFVSRTSDIEDSPVNDRYAEGIHAVPPPMTGIYIPSGPDKEIDESQFTYSLKQSKPSESDAETSNFASCESNSSIETNESVPKPVANEPKAISDPKVWSDAP